MWAIRLTPVIENFSEFVLTLEMRLFLTLCCFDYFAVYGLDQKNKNNLTATFLVLFDFKFTKNDAETGNKFPNSAIVLYLLLVKIGNTFQNRSQLMLFAKTYIFFPNYYGFSFFAATMLFYTQSLLLRPNRKVNSRKSVINKQSSQKRGGRFPRRSSLSCKSIKHGSLISVAPAAAISYPQSNA